ncbi:Rgp1-domain-containing protein [Podospora conica]|nr:Rgp1-domain-containing protein [Schizothecium conicum]
MDSTEMDIDNEDRVFSDSSSSSDDEEYQTQTDGLLRTPDNNHGQTQDMVSPPTSPPTKDSRDSTPVEEPQRPVVMTARAYQLEMLEESLKQNIIVAMDTGSGKTQVQVHTGQRDFIHIADFLSVRYFESKSNLTEAKRSQLVWFLAPTVPLATQQHNVLKLQNPGVICRLITGADNVEAWSNTIVWGRILQNVKIVVSTYQILFDAATHGFVPLSSLSLIVIDEAHNCVRNNAVARLMKELYWPDKNNGLEVPHILGLTASPVMRANIRSLEQELGLLEATLDAVCKAPSKHRAELLAKVNRPDMTSVPYDETDPVTVKNIPSLANLRRAFRQLDITQDPYILHLRKSKSADRLEKLRIALETHTTFAQKQIKTFCNAAQIVGVELGPWATDYYIHRVITEFLAIQTNASPKELSEQYRRYIAECFLKVDAPAPQHIPDNISIKVQALIDILGKHKEATTGIIFARERATVAVLAHILSVHPAMKGHFRVGAMTGISAHLSRTKDFLSLARKDDQQSLHSFRIGKINLLVATSVVEEGIDVPVCNLVICFDEPMSPKTFVQRRGRARHSVCHLYLLCPKSSTRSAETWLAFEDELRRLYEDEQREKATYEVLEAKESSDYPVMNVSETGARLTIEDAKSHLQHFCSTLATAKFANANPIYVLKTVDGKPLDPSQAQLVKAVVHLPPSLVPSLRRFESSRPWYSQDLATKDAAFQAYAKLYEVGLVNKNLLPIQDTDLLPPIEQRTAMEKVLEKINPWIHVAHEWQNENGQLYQRRLRFSNQDGSMIANIDVTLPVPVPYMQPLTLYWDSKEAWTVTSDETMRSFGRQDAMDGATANHTRGLLTLAFGHRHRWTDAEKQHPVRLTVEGLGMDLRVETEPFTVEAIRGRFAGHLLREPAERYAPYIYQDWLPCKPPAQEVGRLWKKGHYGEESVHYDDAPSDVPYVAVKNWPKKAGFFNRALVGAEAKHSKKRYPRVQPDSLVRIDRHPAVLTHVGMLIPALTFALETHMMARDLGEGLLKTLHIKDASVILTAISSSSAQLPTDYERIEFLGDSILKFCTTVNLTSQYLIWPEGCLSRLKDNLVSNSRLFRAAIETGLDRYMITQSFTIRRQLYVEDLLSLDLKEVNKRERLISTKMPADVIESLIGTAYIDGGLESATECIGLFLTEAKWQSVDLGRSILLANAADDIPLPLSMRPVEDLIGYTFKKKSLLAEALTHPSYSAAGSVPSFDRLEFLGDALLDYLVVTKLFSHPSLCNSDMHLLKTTLVNADILAFRVMEWTTPGSETVVDSDSSSSGGSPVLRTRTTHRPLWSFMRHSSPDLGAIQAATSRRHDEVRGQLLAALDSGRSYPWAMLARLQPQKFYSDVFESLLGAVWIDSGSMEACDAFLERAGILPLMRRLLRDAGRVRVMHPKENVMVLGGNVRVEYEVVEVEGGDDGEEGGYAARQQCGKRTSDDESGAHLRRRPRRLTMSSSDAYPPPRNNGSTSLNTSPASVPVSNIRVFVRWQDQVVFAGEEVKCTITFKNTARPPQPAGHPLRPSQLSTTSASRHASADGRSRQPSPLSPVGSQHRGKANAGLAPPPSARGHRSTLSLTVPSAASRARAGSGSLPWSPATTRTPRSGNSNGGGSQSEGGGHGHKRSVSIVSIGSVSTVDGGGQGTSSGTAKQQRPARGHARSSSLQIAPRGTPLSGPRSATHPPRLPFSPQSSPLFHASYPPDRTTLNGHPSSTATSPGGSVASTRRSPNPLAEFKFPMTESPASPGAEKLPEDVLRSPHNTAHDIPIRSRDAVPTINEHGVIPSARVLSTTSIAGTPRSSAEFYSLSNNSSETLASEYVSQQPLRTQTRSSQQPHNRRTSSLAPSARTVPEALMMGYAQLQGTFTLDGSLVNLAPFEQVKRKAVVGGHGGGVIGVETTKRDSGLLRSFGWGNFTSSISEILGGGELSTIKEMRGIASSKSIPLLSTPQSILFVDLQLAPGESKTFEYAFQLPKGLPPTHRGKAMKISYSLVIGTQRPGGAKEQQVKSVEVPFRVLGSVNSHGEILGHDLMTPYIILRDQARVQTLDSRAPPKQKPDPAPKPNSTMSSFLTYLDDLLARPQDDPSASLLSPTATPSRRPSTAHSTDGGNSYFPHAASAPPTAKDAIDLAILRANATSPGQQAANRFEIARNGRRVGVVLLARPAYRLGEAVTLAIDFARGEVPCYAVHFALETAERVDASLALRSDASVHRVTRRVWASASEAALYARRVVFCPTIPAGATPEFVTSGVSLEWKVRVEFVVPAGEEGREEGEGEDEEEEGGRAGTGRGPLLEEISRDERGGLVVVAAENLVCESFEVAVPLRVYGASTETETEADIPA